MSNLKINMLLMELKLLSHRSLRFLLSLVWRKTLDRSESIKMLQSGIIYQKQHSPIDDSPLESADKLTKLTLEDLKNQEYREEKSISFEPDYVWKIGLNNQIKSLSISSSGITLINEKFLLDLDFGTTAGYKDSPIKLERVEYPLVIAPWSHLKLFAYFGFVALILAKICRIEEACGKEIWQSAKLCYPLFNTSYENQFLQKLGIPEKSIIDTRTKGLKIQAKSVIVANSQTQINRLSPYDIALLRNRFCLPKKDVTKRKIFLARRKTRLITNEAEVRDVLKSFGFEIVEDVARSVDEQISLFQEASVIVAPHGAGLTNLLWCEPGTKVLELFYGGYKKAGYYYICKILGLEYSCIVDDTTLVDHFVNQYHDMTINIDTLKMELYRILNVG